MSTPEIHELIGQTYDRLHYEHHGRMHRAGLVYLVAFYLDIPEEEVFVTIDLLYGWVEDLAADNDTKDKNDQAISRMDGSSGT